MIFLVCVHNLILEMCPTLLKVLSLISKSQYHRQTEAMKTLLEVSSAHFHFLKSFRWSSKYKRAYIPIENDLYICI